MTESAYKALRRRLLLLACLRGLVFWYGIEKLFQLSIGFSVQNVVMIGIIAQGAKILFELPTSVVADRWSRKKTLVAANAVLIACVFVLGFATTLPVYIAGIALWALGDALQSGVYEAFAYDSLVVSGWKDRFRKVYSRMLSLELMAVAVSGLAAGAIVRFADMRLAFFLSAVSALVSMALLFTMKEPAIQRTNEAGVSWLRHIGGTFRVMGQRQVIWPVTIFMSLMGFTRVWYEYYQLVGIDVGLPDLLFGSFIAILSIAMAVGAEVAHKKAGTKSMLFASWVVLLVSHAVGLRLSHVAFTLANAFLIFVGLRIMRTYLEIYLHDHIPSERRATFFSLAGTLAYAWFFALAFIFSQVLDRAGVRGALIIASAPMLVLGLIDVCWGIPWSMTKKSSDPLVGIEADARTK